MLIPLGKLKHLKQVAAVSHCFHLAGIRRDDEQQCAVRDVGLTIGNSEFIHVISLSSLISYSQLKVGAERESSFFFPGCHCAQK